jgi:hypothetical protein
MLSKNQIAAELEERGLGRRRQIANILDGLASLAAEEIASGQDFTVPGIVKVGWAYTSPLAKGEKHRKGETYVGFGGQEITAEADSKPRKASVKLRATVAAPVKRLAPSAKDARGMAAFLNSKAGKAVKGRKG